MHTISILLAICPSLSAIDSSASDACISSLRSSISALDNSISSLEASSPTWERVSLWSSIFVATGVFLELFSIGWAFHEEKELWRPGITRAPANPSFAKVSLEVFATLIIGIGILGETEASASLSSINDQVRIKAVTLRAKSEELLALITQQAGNAVLSANKAAGSASTANTEALGAKSKAGAVGLEADDLRTKYVAAEQKVAKLEYLLTWRTVTPEQASTLKGFLAPYFLATKVPFRGLRINFGYYNGDLEAYEYASELADALRKALDGFGVDIGDADGIVQFGPPKTGLTMQVRHVDSAAEVLQKAFGLAQIDIPAEFNNLPPRTIAFFVGVKPRPPALQK